MKNDINPNNTELWILNWKRPEVLNLVLKSWFESFEFKNINVVSNHSSVKQEDIDINLRDNVRVWRNVMRHDQSYGPLARTINECYVHTFMTNKKYCICAHDNMLAKTGWSEKINQTDFELLFAPQGDQVHINSRNGLLNFGWWDERYSSNGHHELDYISRALNKCLHDNRKKASLVDIHYWQENKTYTSNNCLNYNNIGLSENFLRLDTLIAPKTGPKGDRFEAECSKWQTEKWGTVRNDIPGYQTTIDGVMNGPKIKQEINWYPWFDIQNNNTAMIGY